MIYAGAAAFAAALVALAVYHLAAVRPALARARHLLEVHDNLIAGGSGSAADRLGALEAADASARTTHQRLSERITELEALAATDLSRAGFIRYDAFSGAGSGLSYALALLNRQGDGVVLTSIYSREDTRTFGKPVAGFKPTVQASAEELEAIERARAAAS
ncbi:MAG TPA: DUF4446 family protein [Candidatus Nitrosotalea sp.]|nr:DUF4446 family protein [Candidatus Nitrosotalea sp.]